MSVKNVEIIPSKNTSVAPEQAGDFFEREASLANTAFEKAQKPEE